jgi:formate hydrogenlyase subunit 3/multisubunit Na+/H+ antiporter MnhD subunit
MMSFGLWALALTMIKRSIGSLALSDIQGLARQKPIVAVSLLVAQFSIGGLPLLAGFPLRVALIEELSIQSTTLAWLIIIGMAGIWGGGLYSLYVMLQKSEKPQRSIRFHRFLPVLMTLGIAFLAFLGLFPQVFSPVLSSMLNSFPRLLIIP